MKIIIPMAGRGSRYADTGYDTPKPLIEVAGKPMLFWALESLLEFDFSTLILIVLEAHEMQFSVSTLVKKYLGERVQSSQIQVITIPAVTKGQLCTVLEAKALIDNEEDILIAASDTYNISNLAQDIRNKPPECSGIIAVLKQPGEQWSFARTDAEGKVVEVAEKRRISEFASNGLYYFSKGSEFVATGAGIVQNGAQTKGEYYVIPVYQKMIDEGKLITISMAEQMWDMGTPEAKLKFEKQFNP